MRVVDLAHTYVLEGDQIIQFIKITNGTLINSGTTNEELLEILLDRTKFLNNKFPCNENEKALVFMQLALEAFNSRTKKRIEQGVETKDVNHVS